MATLTGKAAFVTGGTGGIGKAICKAYLEKGIKVCIADLDVDTGNTTLREFQDTHGDKNVIFQKCDITNENEFEAALLSAKAKFGRLDILVNNAGVCGETMWRKLVEVNTVGTIQGTYLAFKHLSNDKGQKDGTMVILTASLAGIKSFPNVPVYTASKYALVGFVTSWGHESNVSNTGVKVNAVLPAATETDMVKSFLFDSVNKELSLEIAKGFQYLKPETVAKAFVQLLEEDVSGKLLVTGPEGFHYAPPNLYG